MTTIALIACARRKRDRVLPARELYASALFEKSMAFAQRMGADAVFILSARHGLLDREKRIAPYDLTLNRMGATERKAWAGRVLDSLQKEADLENDHFVLLAGKRYREHLEPRLRHCEAPLAGMGIGKQLHWLSEALHEQ